MSRLYAWIESDTRRTQLTTRGNKFIEVRIHYGSKHNSKLAVQILIEYPKTEENPHIHLHIPEHIKVYSRYYPQNKY